MNFPKYKTKVSLKKIRSLPINLQYLLLESKKRNYVVNAIPRNSKKGNDIYQITHNKETMTIISSNHYPDLSYYGNVLTIHKFLAYKMMQDLKVEIPRTFLFNSRGEAVRFWIKKFKQKQVVVKPEDKGLGIDVHIELSTLKAIRKAAATILKKHNGNGVIQEYIEGKDLRIQAVGGKLFAACIRIPANVIGDGKNSVINLINSKNVIKAKFNPGIVIKIDEETKTLLNEQKLNLQSIPKKGTFVKLKKAANIGLGGDPVDVTDELHESFYLITEKISKIFSVKTFAIDFVVKDTMRPLVPKNAYLLEINAPSLWAHHHFAQGKKRNVASAILDAYFYPDIFDPNSKGYLIN